MAPFRVIIIGGGLSGSLLGNGLHNNGVEVTVYERDPQDQKREGYQIRLGDSAMTGFRACLKEDHLHRIIGKFGQSSSSTSTAPSVYNSHFQQILHLTTLPSYSKSWAINRVVLRNLIAEPLEKLGLVRFGKKFTHYEISNGESGSEQVRVHFSDGSVDECDILVGADGGGSTINRQIGLNNIVPIHSHWSFLNKGSLPTSQLQDLPSQLQKGPVMTFTPEASFFYALYLPPKKQDGATGTGTGQLEYDVDEASFYWGLNIPRSYSHYEDPGELPDPLGFCLRYVKNWAPEYHQMIKTGAENEGSSKVLVTALRASNKPSNHWRRESQRDGDLSKGHDRVWLMGDAIHAMQPSRGQGGNQAFHDCADMLPELLALRESAKSGVLSSRQVEEACRRYESTMIERAFAWVKKSGGTTAFVSCVILDGASSHPETDPCLDHKSRRFSWDAHLPRWQDCGSHNLGRLSGRGGET
ncbi:FAD/NAD(P)-binding domain-containing protein [Aspergillus californicus]